MGDTTDDSKGKILIVAALVIISLLGVSTYYDEQGNVIVSNETHDVVIGNATKVVDERANTKIEHNGTALAFSNKKGDYSVSSTALIDGSKFTPTEYTKSEGGKEWSSSDATTSFSYEYSGSTVKETIVLKEPKNLKFEIVVKKGTVLIPWFNGEYKVVEDTFKDTMTGIVIAKPYGIDANGNYIEMDYAHSGNVLELKYEGKVRVLNKSYVFPKEKKDVDQNLVYVWVPVAYPLTIDPTWTYVNPYYSTTVGSDTVLMWNTTGTYTNGWTAPAGVTSVWYLVVAGGAGGGGTSAYGYGGGGGGAGGLLNGTVAVTPENQYTIIVGTGGTQGASTPGAGGDGGNSSFSAHPVQAKGGGGGAGYDGSQAGRTGGSGGGGVGTAGGGTAVSGQGNAGGSSAATFGEGGGGGGASVAGANGVATSSTGRGGNGTAISITGDADYYAGGGGGGGGNSALTIGPGGLGGGGAGGTFVGNSDPGFNGTFYGGAGGGGTSGSGGSAEKGGAGYRGVVIIRYASAAGSAPVASFTKNQTAGTAPLPVGFTDTSTNTPTAWNWSFNNVTGNNTEIWWSTDQNPAITLGTGNWTFALNASNTNGYNITPGLAWVNVSAAPEGCGLLCKFIRYFWQFRLPYQVMA